ncbi:uncharacterized protein LOC110024109 [Phalaenopsis equestris]|uniref:uncharacterized protein LOC110024109 n=1 Tax=Phalaenopsis equestris TaxID=78828 RepID=UPI0009E27EA2|nr:uncharacterized protein LOC110024109 [Phalaenopsis equestris]XP_020579539.1 uncharacterized protein LOC110024109 [Phalaenopsis equestris]
MDSVDPHNEAPCNLTLRDITNTEQAPSVINDASDRKRKRPLYQSQNIYDKDNAEIFHPPKAYEACRNVKGKAPFSNAEKYVSKSIKGNVESQRERPPLEKLCLRGASSAQITRLNSEADDSSIGPVASSSNEDEDLSTESDEPKQTFGLDEQLLRNPVYPIKDHEMPAFSDRTSLDSSFLSQQKADFRETLAYERLQNISLCGSCPCFSCINAAYMWSDLVYQDTRGRLSALKSSRRHARILEGKILRHEKAGETSQSQLKRAKSTESDLLQHWTSLVRHTADSLQREIVQAQSRLDEIEKLKDRFRRDLEALNPVPQNKSE